MSYEVALSSAFLSAFTMPIILSFARKNRLFDSLDERKNHNGNIPRLGGVGMFAAFALMMIALLVIQPGTVARQLASRASKLWPLALAGMLMHIIGLLDDIKPQSAKLKLTIQILAAILVVASGYRFRSFGFRQDAMQGQLEWLSVIISLGWIVGVANAVNFIDGIDGLAGSVSFIIAIVYGIFYYKVGDPSSSLICLSIAGVIVGFLLFNFPMPNAKIFMGDSGSLFLGFSLAVMPFLGQVPGMESTKVGLGLIPSITMLALPVFDALRVMGLRISKGKNPMSPDRQHLHHLFIDSKYKALKVDLIFFLVSTGLALVVLAASDMPQSLGYMFEFIALGLLLIFFRYVKYVNKESIGNNGRKAG